MENSRKSELDGLVEFECRIIDKYLWELVFKVAQYVIWSTWVENHTPACRFVFAADQSAQESNRSGRVFRNDPRQYGAFFG